MAKVNSYFKLADFIPKTWTVLREGYSLAHFRKDLSAGLTVGVVALPLVVVFSIASGATPVQGLWAAIIAGLVAALLGGSRFQVSGPTGALVVIISTILGQYGMSGLIAATMLSGLMLVAMGLAGFGNIIRYMPYPVTAGFTTGIGAIIASGQLKDLFGLQIPDFSPEFFTRLVQTFRHLPELQFWSLGTGLLTIVAILLIRRFFPRLPVVVLVVSGMAALVWLFHVPVETIGSRYGAIPKGLPPFSFAVWNEVMLKDIFSVSFTLALLSSIVTIGSAVVADGLSGDKLKPNMELVAQGVANMAGGLFGGIPVTGAIARTVVNIKHGAWSPFSAVIHALVLLLFTLLLGGLVSLLPLPALAGLLLVVAWDMSDIKRFIFMRNAPKSDLFVMLATFLLTIAIGITVAVEIGVLMALILFLRRIMETSSVMPLQQVLVEAEDSGGLATHAAKLPEDCEVYEIVGPFFFGTADFLQDILDRVEYQPKVFVLRMRRVPAIDATGMNALVSFLKHCEKHGTTLVLSGVRDQPFKALSAMGLVGRIGEANILADFSAAVARVHELLPANRRS